MGGHAGQMAAISRAASLLGDSAFIASLFANGALGAWYDASDISTLYQGPDISTPVTAFGQPVGLVMDKSGNGNHLVQTTSMSRGTYRLGPNGRPSVFLDGIDDGLLGPVFNATAYTRALMGAAFTKNSDAARAPPLYISGNSAAAVPGYNFYLWAPVTNGSANVGARLLTYPSGATMDKAVGGLKAPSTQALLARANVTAGTTPLVGCWLNGVDQGEITTGVSKTGTFSNLSTISFGPPGGAAAAVDMYAAVVLFGNYTQAQIDTINAYLVTKASVR